MRVGKKNDEKFLKINNALFGYSTEKNEQMLLLMSTMKMGYRDFLIELFYLSHQLVYLRVTITTT